jgi:hypothetical protein
MKRIAYGLAAMAVAAAVVAINETVSAHLTAVSPYTYWRDVVPILETRCAQCHADGGVSGLSLLNYQSARGSTWLIRQQLIRGHMPPWFADGPFKSPVPVTSREVNILMTWASGGAPEGKPLAAKAHQAPAWTMGTPDLVATMPSAFTFTTDEGDQVHEVALPSAKIGGRTVRAVDVLPGTPALVRSAEIIARSAGRDQILGLWQPGELVAALAVDAGFRVPSDAKLILRIRYRRTYGSPASDQSKVGVYFADRRAAPIQTIELTADAAGNQTQIVRRPSRIVSIRQVSGRSGAGISIAIEGADGAHRDLGRIQVQRDWARRYVLDTPVDLAAGDKIVISTRQSQSELWNTLTSERTDLPSPAALAFEIVDQPRHR